MRPADSDDSPDNGVRKCETSYNFEKSIATAPQPKNRLKTDRAPRRASNWYGRYFRAVSSQRTIQVTQRFYG